MDGQEQSVPNVLNEQEKMKKFKGLFKLAMVIIFVLLVVLAVNAVRIGNLEGAYAKGYNECVEKCNNQINTLKTQCVPINVDELIVGVDTLPLPQDIEGNASIQIVTQ